MFKSKTTIVLASLAAACGLFALWLTVHTAHGYMAVGAVPTSDGVAAMTVSILGSLGFSVAGIINALFHRVTGQTGNVSDGTISEVIELTASFAALMKDKTNRAAQRRFFFALVDASKLITGVETSHDSGVIVIKYSGYADPLTPASPATK